MALDLFFVPRKLTLEAASSADLVITPAMVRVRHKLIEALLAAHPEARLEGDPQQGRLAGFCRGELTLEPGYVSWALHGVTDEAPIHEIVTWFHDQNMVCEDPQAAGFGNRDLKHGAVRVTLTSFEDLVGARFSGVRLLREWVAGILTEWTLADGNYALIQFVRFDICRLPDLGKLLNSKVVGVNYEIGNFELDQFNTLRVYFESDLELALEGAIFQRWSVQEKRPR